MSRSSARSPSTSASSGISWASRRREADRLGAQLVAHEVLAARRGVALVEDQVDDGEHGAEPVRQLGVAGDAVGDVGVADLALGPDQPLRHRRLRHEEGAGDLVGLQTSEQAQRQRDLDVRRQRRVAAREDQPQAVVLHGSDRFGWFVALVDERGLGVSVMAGCLAPEPVDGTVAGRRRDPRTGVRRQSGLGPALRRHDERFLDRLFGDVDVAEETDQRRDRTSGLVPEDAAELRIVQCWHDWSRRRVPCRDRPGKGGPRPRPCTRPSPSPPTPARRRDRRPR